MPWLIDTNVPLRALHRADPFHEAAWGAVRILRRRGEVLCCTHQTLAEFWAVSTRPVAARGGFGLSVIELIGACVLSRGTWSSSWTQRRSGPTGAGLLGRGFSRPQAALSDPEFAAQMEAAEEIMGEDRDALRGLAG